MCEGMTLATLATMAVGTGVTAAGNIQAGEYAAKIARQNALLARRQAVEERRAGAEQAGEVRRLGSEVQGQALAAAGASGVETTSGSMANIFKVSAMNIETDVTRARANAARRAWGYEAEAAEQEAQGEMARRRGILGAFGAGLEGFGAGLQVYGRYRRGVG